MNITPYKVRLTVIHSIRSWLLFEPWEIDLERLTVRHGEIDWEYGSIHDDESDSDCW
jgi:hypothetical protein